MIKQLFQADKMIIVKTKEVQLLQNRKIRAVLSIVVHQHPRVVD